MTDLVKNKFYFLKDKKIEFFLILLIPFSAVFSIFVLELTLVYISFSFLTRISNNFEKKYIFNKFILFFSIFYFYLLLRYFFSETYDHESYKFVIFYFRYGLYVVSIYYFLNNIANLENYFYKSVILCAIILVLDSFFQFFVGSNILGYRLIDENRVSSFFNEESVLGSFLIKILPFIFIYLFKNFNKQNQIYLFLLIINICITIFISGERAAFFLMLLLLTFYFVLFLKTKFFKVIVLALPLLILFVTLIFIFSDNVKIRYTTTFNEFLKYKKFDQPNITSEQIDRVNNEILDSKYTKGNFYIISPTHNNYFITAQNMFLDNKIFGHGPKSFRNLCSEDKFGINVWSCSTHPHNYYIQLLAEFGLIGFIFPFLVFCYFIMKIILDYVSRKEMNVNMIFYSFFLINLWPLTSTGNFFNNWTSILIYIPFSFYILYLNKKDNV